MKTPIGIRLTNGIAQTKELEGLKEWYEWMAVQGFQVVDVPILTPEIKAAVEAAGLTVGSFDILTDIPKLFSRDEEIRRHQIKVVCEKIIQAAELGGKLGFLCLIPEDATMPKEESFELFKDGFPAVVETAEQCGITLVMEGFPGRAPYYPALGSTPASLRAIFEAIPSQALGLTFDPSHLVRLGIDYMRFINEFSSRIAHAHAKDCRMSSEGQYLLGYEGSWSYPRPGEGVIDWAAIAAELERIKYKGALCIELEDQRYLGSLELKREGFTRTFQFLKPFF